MGLFERPWFQRTKHVISLVSGPVTVVTALMAATAAQGMKSPGLWKNIITYGLGGVALLAAGLWLGAWLYDRRSKTAEWPSESLKNASTKLVGRLHERWFRHEREFDANHRVSMFIPHAGGDGAVTWRCIARTITPPERAAAWPQVEDPERRTKAGLINLAVTDMTNADVSGVPDGDRENAEVEATYLRASCLTAEMHARRSWPWASIRVRIARGLKSKILCAIVVERKDGHPIRMTSRTLAITEQQEDGHREHDPCEWEHQLAADLWAAIRDD